MTKFRMVRAFANPLTAGPGQTSNRAYKVETVELLTEAEALALMAELGSPYQN